MKWIKDKISGQVTISTLTGICILVGAIGAPFVYIKNIEAETIKVNAQLAQIVAVNSNRLTTLEENYKNINAKLDTLLMKLK